MMAGDKIYWMKILSLRINLSASLAKVEQLNDFMMRAKTKLIKS